MAGHFVRVALRRSTLLLGTLLLAGCGFIGSDDPEFNDADVDFAVEMQQHHQQSLAMTDLVPSRSDDPEVERMAAAIAEAQGAEIDAMAAWIMEWAERGAELPGHGVGTQHIPGMVSDEDMTALTVAKGGAFDTLWLETMIAHHKGGLELAQAQLEDGKNADAKEMAEEALMSQQAEIAEMEQVLASLG